MSNIDPGTYRGVSEGLTFEFRIECASGGGEACVVSGDITRGTDFIASFICQEPQLGGDGWTITGALRFRGNPELFTGTMYLNTDQRGIGSFQVAIDLEGGYRDIFAGRLDWQGSFLRRLLIEVDGIQGTQAPVNYATRSGAHMSVERAFEQAGFDVQLVVDPFKGRGSSDNQMRGYTLAEVHTAMSERRSHVPADRLHAHVFVCSYLAGRGNRGVLGVMYDFGQNDLNSRPREGVAVFYDHPMLSDPRVSEESRKREYIFTLVHEIGHALNLLHSFDKARPSSLSWMNYPHLYPRGYEAGQGYDGTPEFWRRFEERFDEEELRHLRHASPREIRAGGFAFGTYEDGMSVPFGGTAEPRRTRLGANPLRVTRAVNLQIAPVKREYDLGEPIFLRLGVKNDGADAVHVPDSLDPAEGYVRLIIRTPAGQIIRYRPPVKLCKQAQLVHLPPGQEMPPFEGLPLFLSSDGPIFTEPGVYQVVAELTGVDGSKNVYSQATRVRVRAPNDATEEFAQTLWDKPAVLEALYLRHPLVARDAWSEMEEDLKRAKLRPENTTESYFNYIAGLGWMTPFAPPDKREKEANVEKAAERLEKVDPQGLPPSVANRKEAVLKGHEELVAATAERGGVASRARVTVGRPEEKMRAEVSPSGLFGSMGLAEEITEATLNPFARIAPKLTGLRGFADIVSWNIEHLHAPNKFWRIPKIAELIRSFRCDFWGLQEVDQTSLARLKETLNSSGQTRYDFVAVEGSGQQSGAVFRTDTTTVNVLPLPNGFFKEKMEVQMSDGSKPLRKVFVRAPLLCDVSVRQTNGKVFDFRCAVVHLKSTDKSIKDTGNSMRLAAARELTRWIEFDRASGQERDYLIMGDMNAETSQQGLKDFAEQENLKLLSVGMRDKYGEEALTRVASGRQLDHIIVTGDAFAQMPAEDEEEQIIIRYDTEVGDFTSSFSDHVPVAVRFIIGKDKD
jgi:endonuclease/exonuclease/phosphatase family metal-dependent hydrolase